jgi:hypothetical protein
MPRGSKTSHMYTKEKMRRNLTVGNITEAFFRVWWEGHVGHVGGLELQQLGFNPAGIVEGKDKAEMLKAHAKSPDFALVRPDQGDAIVAGISINGQRALYTMENAREPSLCHECERKDDCYRIARAGTAEAEGNLWYNLYNITNDYPLFVQGYDAPVVLVSIIGNFPNTIQGKVERDFKQEAWDTLRGVDDGSESMASFRRYLLYSRGSLKGGRRQYRLVWNLHNEVESGRTPYSVAGAPVSRGLPRKVACVDASNARGEDDLVAFFEALAE